jgi:hypothetical protein
MLMIGMTCHVIFQQAVLATVTAVAVAAVAETAAVAAGMPG